MRSIVYIESALSKKIARNKIKCHEEHRTLNEKERYENILIVYSFWRIQSWIKINSLVVEIQLEIYKHIYATLNKLWFMKEVN
jgi:hypothetical protein